MDATTLAEMLDHDRREWEALVALLDARAGVMLGADSSSWTTRDVYTHLARWMSHSTADLKAHLAGSRLPLLEGTEDEINARWQREDSTLSFEEARRRAHRAFAARMEAIRWVPLRRWDPALDAIAHADGYKHFAVHRQCIESERG